MAERPPLRVLIVDDEPLGVERVRELLSLRAQMLTLLQTGALERRLGRG